MGLDNLLQNGGKILVVGGKNSDWPEFRDNPRIEFWSGEASDMKHYAGKDVPTNIRAVIVSRFIDHSTEGGIARQARERRITFFHQKNTGEITRLLEEITGKSKAEQKEDIKEKRQVGRGVLKQLVEKHDDATIGSSESGEKIFRIARDNNIMTTLISCKQAVRNYRKSKGITDRPASISAKKSPIDILILAFDDAIAGLQLAREAAVNINKENTELKEYKTKVEKLLGDLK